MQAISSHQIKTIIKLITRTSIHTKAGPTNDYPGQILGPKQITLQLTQNTPIIRKLDKRTNNPTTFDNHAIRDPRPKEGLNNSQSKQSS